MRKFLLPFFCILFCLARIYGNESFSTIELTYGGSVTGEVLKDKPEQVFVDIGFTILEIPRESIVRILTEQTEKTQQQGLNKLYASGQAQRPELPIKELVDQYGQTVVLIRTPTGLGSGFFINNQGYVITNDHVIAGEHKISVTLYERRANEMVKTPFENVRIVAASAELDLALLKIEGVEDLDIEPVTLGDSIQLRSGQKVFAIGSPLGLERTVSEGIISLKNRLIGGQLYIQNTAQISPGNSGGPLFNLRGEVVGVNNMKVMAMGAEGLGFAIPSSTLKTFLKNRDAFAFDPRNPNSGFRYNEPPRSLNE